MRHSRFLDVGRSIRRFQTVEILVFIGDESLENTARIKGDGTFGIEEFFFVGIRDETEFEQASGHRSEAQNGQIILVGTLVGDSRRGTDVFLHQLREFDASLHVRILNKLEENVAFG